MGYDLHITRRSDWSDTATLGIPESEWLRAISGDTDADAFYWHDGDISVKNPDSPLIAKMVRLAGILGARVQGDDGELYREDGTSFDPSPVTAPTPSPGVFRRIAQLWRRTSPTPSSPFRVGQRVKDVLGGLGTVYVVDPKANGGLGSLKVTMDDGSEQHRACVASGFEAALEQSTGG